MRLRYDIYIEFNTPREEDAGAIARNVGRNINDGLMGIAGSHLHENNLILTSMFFIDPTIVFKDVEATYGSELPDNIEKRLEDEFTGYVDVAVQRINEDNYEE